MLSVNSLSRASSRKWQNLRQISEDTKKRKYNEYFDDEDDEDSDDDDNEWLDKFLNRNANIKNAVQSNNDAFHNMETVKPIKRRRTSLDFDILEIIHNNKKDSNNDKILFDIDLVELPVPDFSSELSDLNSKFEEIQTFSKMVSDSSDNDDLSVDPVKFNSFNPLFAPRDRNFRYCPYSKTIKPSPTKHYMTFPPMSVKDHEENCLEDRTRLMSQEFHEKMKSFLQSIINYNDKFVKYQTECLLISANITNLEKIYRQIYNHIEPEKRKASWSPPSSPVNCEPICYMPSEDSFGKIGFKITGPLTRNQKANYLALVRQEVYDLKIKLCQKSDHCDSIQKQVDKLYEKLFFLKNNMASL